MERRLKKLVALNQNERILVDNVVRGSILMNKQLIINTLELSPTTGIRRISQYLNIFQSSVRRTLHETLLYLFNITRVQDLLPKDLTDDVLSLVEKKLFTKSAISSAYCGF